jgi:hypothetical protein
MDPRVKPAGDGVGFFAQISAVITGLDPAIHLFAKKFSPR